jgi:LmbE family N-acetylglucosaminyl deacetylase
MMNVLAIGAHADDVELGLGGTISKHVSNGDNVHILLVTHSEYTNFDGKLVRSRETALEEAHNAAKIMGVSRLSCLNYETKAVTYDVRLIEDINRHIDHDRANVVYTHWDGDINQDHSAISQATIVAGRNVPRLLMYRSNWYKSYKHFENNFYVDVSEFIEKKIEAIRAHSSEMSRRGDDWTDFFKNQCRINGQEVGVRYAESFQVVKWLT